MARFGILVGGGPAPGINGVIGAATLLARRHGAEVLGLLDGFQWLMQGDTSHAVELGADDVALVHLQGGSILRTSRANPTRKPEDLRRVVESLAKLGVDHLVTIGGDDTAFSARRVAEEGGGRIRVAHVPKTIDNDLPLPDGIPTFGFETAREHATRLLANLNEDARTAGRWYFVVVMGRSVGFLALGAAKAAGAAIALVPEEFDEKTPLARVRNLLEGAIVKRMARGRSDGVAVISEGIGLRLDPRDLEDLKDAERDEHGHVRLAEIPLGKVLQDAVRGALAERGVKVTIVAKDVGYELRCAPPNAFDLDYTRDLGAGAVRTLLAGTSGVMVTRQAGAIVPVPFDAIADPKTGRTRVRRVDTSSASHRTALELQQRVEAADLADPQRLAALAAAAKLTPEQARERYQAGV
jgi:6-phosphofructokinase 1